MLKMRIDNSIVFIVPNKKVVSTINKVLQDIEVSHPVYYGSLDKALNIAEVMVTEKTKVIISFGLTAKYLQKNLPIPVLEMIFSTVDFMNAIREAQTYSSKILIIASCYLSFYAKKSLSLLEQENSQIHFTELTLDKPIKEQVHELIDSGYYDVIISGTPSIEIAEIEGIKGIHFDIDSKMVEMTLKNARSLAEFQRGREEKELLIQEIINRSPEGLILTNENHLVTSLNRSAEKLLSAPRKNIVGKPAEEVLAEYKVVDVLDESIAFEISEENIFVLLNRVPIHLNNEYKGALISIRDAQEIRELGQKAHKRLLAKGHVARSTFSDILGSSRAIERARDKARVFAKHDSTVLLLGETGVGKELFAQSIHNASKRKNQAFVAVNCAAIPEDLLESELFGYVKGAFTGASEQGKTGLFEAANLGTIFLDEVSEISLRMQTRLLRVIQEKELVRIGDDNVKTVDIRVISASNRDLYNQVVKGLFREDLYYRLCVLDLEIPSLRERKEDIEIIANSMIHNKNIKFNKNINKLDLEMLEFLQSMNWPGNIRQLDNMIEKCVILTEKNHIYPSLLEAGPLPQKKKITAPGRVKMETLQDMEQRIIKQTLEKVGNNKAECARLLGIDNSTLWRKLKKMEKRG